MQTLSTQLILLLLQDSQVINTSYLLHQIFTRLGIFLSVEELILEMEKEQLIKTDGYFEGNSKLIKNIQITEKGLEYISNNNKAKILSDMESKFSNFDSIKKVIA